MNLKNCFNISTEDEFNRYALEVFKFQSENVPIYKKYIDTLKIDANAISHYKKIPFLPIGFFKSHDVITNERISAIEFCSSGTTGNITSRHKVVDVDLYIESFTKGFNFFYGDIQDYCVIALLPSYLERNDSSLVYMCNHLIQESRHPDSGFYLNQYHELQKLLQQLCNLKQKTVLFGVTFALLDLVENFPISFPDLIVLETGGMKGRRKEVVREELHLVLKKAFNVAKIHSEYGMTELLSQAYSTGNGIFETPPWMKVLIRDINDPFEYLNFGLTGGVNVIDLANYYSCSFLETHDLGKLNDRHQFEILGRFDNSDLRGCNLLIF